MSTLDRNLNQLAKAVNTGSLPVSAEVEAELIEAFSEADAIAQGARCKNYLFSMS